MYLKPDQHGDRRLPVDVYDKRFRSKQVSCFVLCAGEILICGIHTHYRLDWKALEYHLTFVTEKCRETHSALMTGVRCWERSSAEAETIRSCFQERESHKIKTIKKSNHEHINRSSVAGRINMLSGQDLLRDLFTHKEILPGNELGVWRLTVTGIWRDEEEQEKIESEWRDQKQKDVMHI